MNAEEARKIAGGDVPDDRQHELLFRAHVIYTAMIDLIRERASEGEYQCSFGVPVGDLKGIYTNSAVYNKAYEHVVWSLCSLLVFEGYKVTNDKGNLEIRWDL